MSDHQKIHIDNLYADPEQSRSSKIKRIDQDFIDSVKEDGILNPLTVRPRPDSDGYYVFAGSRRHKAALEVGISEVPCTVRDVDEFEASELSFKENVLREDLSQYELAQTTKRRFDTLAEDLIDDSDGVECPDCHWTGDSGKSLERHVNQSHGGLSNLSEPPCEYFSREDIYKQIAKNTPYDIDTVRRLVKIASLPDDLIPFVQTPEERGSESSDYVSNYASENFTLASDQDSVISQKVLTIAEYYDGDGDYSQSIIEKTIEKFYKDYSKQKRTSSKLKEALNKIDRLFYGWIEYGEDYNRAIEEAINGNHPPEEATKKQEEASDASKEEETEDSGPETEKDDKIEVENIENKRKREPKKEKETTRNITKTESKEKIEEKTEKEKDLVSETEDQEETEWVIAKIKLTKEEKQEAISSGSLTIPANRIEW